MCILCVVQRWSRRVATMLPWLVIPFILLWALSQLFPPNFRFEITSARLACVVVLLVTLIWYEILMPRLSVWRARQSARLQKQRMVRAIELQKLKKSATRKCRNCNTPYRDQNPGGGKFMCGYCGHVSRRPVLDWYGEENGGDGRCLDEKLYSGLLAFRCRLVEMVREWARLVLGKVVRRDGGEGGGLSRNGGEDGTNFQESRGERARRKAEEKRQAKLEREMLEEEERKQREEVARLVEERRRLRDEMFEVEEQEKVKGLAGVDVERESRKETERRKPERRKAKGLNKSNSDDGEEVEKSASKEIEKKREFDNKGEIERHKALVENFKSQVLDGGNVSKVGASKSRYFDRMKGTFLSSSRGFNSASFFGRTAQVAPTVPKVSRPAVGFVDNKQNPLAKKDAPSSQNLTGNYTVNGDHQPVGPNVQPRTMVLKKSWQQLFTRSSPVSPDPEISTLNFPTQNGYLDARGVTDQKIFPSYSDDKQVDFGRSLPLSGYSSPNGSLNGDLVTQVAEDCMFFPMKEPAHSSVIQDAELFEDPCYIPDPVAFQGPVSNSLNKLPLDLGTGFIGGKVEGPCIIKNLSAAHELIKPSPIERHISCAPKSQKLHSSSLDESTNAQGQGWQMWGTPLTQDGLGLAGGPTSWFTPLVQCKSEREDLTHPLCHNPIIPQMANVDNPQTHGRFSPVVPGINGNDPWLQNSPFSPQLPVDRESHYLPLDLIQNITQNEDNTPVSSETVHPFEVPSSDGWSKEAWSLNGTHDVGNSATPVQPPNIGSLFSTGPDVRSVWSFNHQ